MPGMTDRNELNEHGARFRQALIENAAQAFGNKPSDAVRLSPDEEIEEWLRPTSPAALRTLELGGSPEEAEQANVMWAAYLKQQQAQAKAQGATSEQLQQAGLTDDLIFKQCRAQAYELARTNAHGNPKKMVEYHKNILKRIAERQQQPQMSYATMSGGEGDA